MTRDLALAYGAALVCAAIAVVDPVARWRRRRRRRPGGRATAALALAAALLAGPARADEWTRTDTAWEAGVVALILVDWGQTRWFRAEVNGYENNPVLGRDPSSARVNTTIAGAMAAHVVAARLLPHPYRRFLQVVTVAGELHAVTGNALEFGFHVRF